MVTDTDLSVGLKAAFVNTLLAGALGAAQNEIGGAFSEGSTASALLHGLAGCAAAEASGGDCAAGASAGITQSLYAGGLGDSTLTEAQQQSRVALLGALAG